MAGSTRLSPQLPAIKSRCIEKKLFVEADAERARVLARAGVDGIQFDKVPVADLDPLVQELRGIDPRLTLIAAGGVNPDNAGGVCRLRGGRALQRRAPFAAKRSDERAHAGVLTPVRAHRT